MVDVQVADLNKTAEAFEFMTESFDFVNSRFIAAGLAMARWPSYITDIRRYAMNFFRNVDAA